MESLKLKGRKTRTFCRRYYESSTEGRIRNTRWEYPRRGVERKCFQNGKIARSEDVEGIPKKSDIQQKDTNRRKNTCRRIELRNGIEEH